MGRKVEAPRYNILSCRVTDKMRDQISDALGGQTIQEFMNRAITDALIRKRQMRMDDYLREKI